MTPSGRRKSPDIMGRLLDGKKPKGEPGGQQDDKPAGQHTGILVNQQDGIPVSQQASKKVWDRDKPAGLYDDKIKCTYYFSREGYQALDELTHSLKGRLRLLTGKTTSMSQVIDTLARMALADFEAKGMESEIAKRVLEETLG